MKRLPEITLNGNLGAWVAFFGFLGSVIAGSVMVGMWIMGVNVKTGKTIELEGSIDSLTASVRVVAKHVDELSKDLEDVGTQLDGVRMDAGKIRMEMAKTATKAWVLGLRGQAEIDHREFRSGVRELRTNTERLEELGSDLRERIERIENRGRGR